METKKTTKTTKNIKKSAVKVRRKTTPKAGKIVSQVENITTMNEIPCSCGPECVCPINKKKLGTWIALIILVLLIGLYFLKGFFVVALVNNKPISRFALDRELEKQAGKAVLNNKIAEMLVIDEGKKQNIVIPQEEIDAKINEIEEQIKAQGQTLEALFTAQGMTMADFVKQIKIQLLVEKMLGEDIVIEDKAISDYFNENKAMFPAGATLENQKEDIKESLYQNELSAKIQPWLEELKAKAKIINFVEF